MNKDIDKLSLEELETLKITVDKRIRFLMWESIKNKQANCDNHIWKYLYTGRHGSDKGDHYFECVLCGADKQGSNII